MAAMNRYIYTGLGGKGGMYSPLPRYYDPVQDGAHYVRPMTEQEKRSMECVDGVDYLRKLRGNSSLESGVAYPEKYYDLGDDQHSFSSDGDEDEHSSIVKQRTVKFVRSDAYNPLGGLGKLMKRDVSLPPAVRYFSASSGDLRYELELYQYDIVDDDVSNPGKSSLDATVSNIEPAASNQNQGGRVLRSRNKRQIVS